jgi:DNA-binding IclR family transcriptional regulator
MILDVLSDGKWHSVEELQKGLELDEDEVREVTEFLNKYDLAKVDEKNGKVKIDRNFQKLLTLSAT